MTNEEKSKLRFVGTDKGTTVFGKLCDFCVYASAKYTSFGEQPEICKFTTDICINQKPYYFFTQKNEKSIIVFYCYIVSI